MEENAENLEIVTLSRMIQDLRRLGLSPGQTVMLHASVKAVGWVVGGPDMVLQAILDILTGKGTLMMMVSWEDSPYELSNWPPERQRAYLEECPSFDPATSRANRDFSILTEYLRTRPGACRSGHPDGSFAAIGSLARRLTQDHPLFYGYGPGSPLAKLCEAEGKVLMLGAPLDSITMLHYAEYLADVPDKRVVHYKMPILRSGQRVWVDIEEYDTDTGIVDWQGEDYFSLIGKEYLASGKGVYGKVGAALSYLFDAADLVKFGKEWMEKNFGHS